MATTWKYKNVNFYGSQTEIDSPSRFDRFLYGQRKYVGGRHCESSPAELYFYRRCNGLVHIPYIVLRSLFLAFYRVQWEILTFWKRHGIYIDLYFSQDIDRFRVWRGKPHVTWCSYDGTISGRSRAVVLYEYQRHKW